MDPDEVNNMISGCTVDTATSETEGNHIAIVDVTEDYVVIETGANGFSPFALAWEADNGGSDTPDNPGWTPGGGDDGPDGLNTEDHFSYIVGYAEDYRTGEPTDNEDLWPVKPNNQITRAEVATIFYRLLKEDVRDRVTSDVNDFSDVASGDWFNVTVSSLAQMGVIAGYEDGSFRPNAPITRAEFAAIATRFFAERGVTYNEGLFADITGDEWFADVVAAAADRGLLGGYPDGTVRPNATITRAESCAVVNRTLDRNARLAGQSCRWLVLRRYAGSDERPRIPLADDRQEQNRRLDSDPAGQYLERTLMVLEHSPRGECSFFVRESPSFHSSEMIRKIFGRSGGRRGIL